MVHLAADPFRCQAACYCHMKLLLGSAKLLTGSSDNVTLEGVLCDVSVQLQDDCSAYVRHTHFAIAWIVHRLAFNCLCLACDEWGT